MWIYTGRCSAIGLVSAMSSADEVAGHSPADQLPIEQDYISPGAPAPN